MNHPFPKVHVNFWVSIEPRENSSLYDFKNITLYFFVGETFHRSRPSQDIRVSALGILGPPEASSYQGAYSLDSRATPSLVSGVAIRKTVLPSGLALGKKELSSSSKADVQTMNQVNQAISIETSPIISPEEPKSLNSQGTAYPFMPYLLVHDLGLLRNTREKRLKEKLEKAPVVSSGKGTVVSGMQDMYMPQIIEMDEESDVQIIGVTPAGIEHAVSNMIHQPPTTTTLCKNLMTPSGSKDLSTQTEESTSERGSGNNGSTQKHGRVIQCISLPKQLGGRHFIRQILPTMDGRHLIVVVATTASEDESPSSTNSANSSKGNSPVEEEQSASKKPKMDDSVHATAVRLGLRTQNDQDYKGGCVLLYKVIIDKGGVVLDTLPSKIFPIPNPDDTVASFVTLPLELSNLQEEEEEIAHLSDAAMGISLSNAVEDIPGQVAVTTASGMLHIRQLADFRLLAEVAPGEGDKFTGIAYCAGEST